MCVWRWDYYYVHVHFLIFPSLICEHKVYILIYKTISHFDNTFNTYYSLSLFLSFSLSLSVSLCLFFSFLSLSLQLVHRTIAALVGSTVVLGVLSMLDKVCNKCFINEINAYICFHLFHF